jgi:hypothetical protein
MLPQIVNSFGLVLDIVGGFILFWRGFPQPSFPRGDALLVHKRGSTTAEKSREEKEQYTRISKLGLALLMIGFVFQLLATWL